MFLSSPKHLPGSKRSVCDVVSDRFGVPHAVIDTARTAIPAARLAAPRRVKVSSLFAPIIDSGNLRPRISRPTCSSPLIGCL